MQTIVFYIYALGRGGAERVLLTVAEFLSSTYNVIILTDTIVDNEYDLPLKVQRIVMNKNENSKLGRLGKIVKREYSIRKQCKELKADVIVAFSGKASCRMIFALYGRKIVKIAAQRIVPEAEFTSTFSMKVAEFCYKRADLIVFQTQDQMKYFGKKVEKKSIVIKNPLRKETCKEQFKGTREEIVSVGRIVSDKNQKLLIDAFIPIHEEYPNLKLVIYGEGEERQKLLNYIKVLGLSDFISMPGQVKNVEEKIYRAKLFVLTSDYEGIPNVLLEAMALGVPVISTDCIGGGARELIKDGINGYLIPRNDKIALIDRIRYLLSEEELASSMGREAQKIQEELDQDKICMRWEKEIIDIFQKHGKVE